MRARAQRTGYTSDLAPAPRNAHVPQQKHMEVHTSPSHRPPPTQNAAPHTWELSSCASAVMLAMLALMASSVSLRVWKSRLSRRVSSSRPAPQYMHEAGHVSCPMCLTCTRRAKRRGPRQCSTQPPRPVKKKKTTWAMKHSTAPTNQLNRVVQVVVRQRQQCLWVYNHPLLSVPSPTGYQVFLSVPSPTGYQVFLSVPSPTGYQVFLSVPSPTGYQVFSLYPVPQGTKRVSASTGSAGPYSKGGPACPTLLRELWRAGVEGGHGREGRRRLACVAARAGAAEQRGVACHRACKRVRQAARLAQTARLCVVPAGACAVLQQQPPAPCLRLCRGTHPMPYQSLCRGTHPMPYQSLCRGMHGVGVWAPAQVCRAPESCAPAPMMGAANAQTHKMWLH